MSSDTTYETYYVPHNSALPFFASLGIFLTVFGAGNIMNEMSSGTESSFGEIVFMMGGLVMAATLFSGSPRSSRKITRSFTASRWTDPLFGA